MWIMARHKDDIHPSLINLDMISRFDVDDDNCLIATMKDNELYVISDAAEGRNIHGDSSEIDTLKTAIREKWPVFHGRVSF